MYGSIQTFVRRLGLPASKVETPKSKVVWTLHLRCGIGRWTFDLDFGLSTLANVADSLQRVVRVLPLHHNQLENSLVFSGTEVARPFCIGDVQST